MAQQIKKGGVDKKNSMRKALVSLLIAFLCLTNCAYVKTPEIKVSEELKNQYNASVTIVTKDGMTVGSGTIIHNRSGQRMAVLSAAHVIRAMAEKQQAPHFLVGKEIVPAVVWKIDHVVDLVLLVSKEIREHDGPYVKIAKEHPRIGSPIILIGAPLGMARTVTAGVVGNFLKVGKKHMYRIDAAAFFGNSGGGAFNDGGELVGVAHAIQILGPYVVPGGAFAISVDVIRDFL